MVNDEENISKEPYKALKGCNRDRVNWTNKNAEDNFFVFISKIVSIPKTAKSLTKQDLQHIK